MFKRFICYEALLLDFNIIPTSCGLFDVDESSLTYVFLSLIAFFSW